MKPYTQKLFCFDVDGTIRSNYDHRTPESAVVALHKLKAAGHKIVICTGRGWDSLKKTQVCDIVAWDGFACNSGQTLLDGNHNVIEKYVFDPKVVLETIAVADSLDMPVILKKDQRIITREPNTYVYEVQKFFNNYIPPVGTYNGKDDVYAMVLYGPMGWDYAPYLTIKGLHVAPGVQYYADATIEGVTKGNACLRFARRFGMNEYTCFGDSQNDMEMFETAAFSICMGNGDQVMKERADYLTDSLDHDGLYKACEALGFFNREER